MRVEHLVTGDLDLSDPRTIVILHRLMPVDARCRQRVEVGNVRCIQFQKAAGIAFPPTVEGTAFEHEDLIGTRSDVDCIDHVILRCMRSNARASAAKAPWTRALLPGSATRLRRLQAL